ncbi:MAG: hypothetical protein WA971_15265 [Microbacterium sp.]
MHTDMFDDLLRQSDPVTALSPAERRAVARMIDQSETVTSWPRVRLIAIGAIAAALLGGGSVAMAATGLWSGWAQNDPLAILYYELPSGASCEMRIGNVRGATDEVDEVIREALADVRFDETDIAKALEARGVTGDPAADDDLYQNGFNLAVTARMQDALEAHGLDGKWAAINAEGACQ